MDKSTVTYHPLVEYLTEYRENNIGNKYKPVAVGRYGIRTRESIYSKELAKDYSKNKLIYKDTLTVGMGSKQIDIGVLTREKIYSVSPAYHTFKINGIDSEYLRYCLECRNADMFARYVKRGSRQGKTIDIKRWINYKIPVYKSSDQHEIVEILNKVLHILELLDKQIESLTLLEKARFVEMFGDPVINPNHYQVHQLKDFIENLTSGSRGWAKYCIDGGNEWFITIKNVKDSHILTDNMQPVNAPNNVEAKRTRVQEGDLLISITADLGRTGVVTKEIADHGAYINQHLTCIRLNREYVDPLFVSFFMESAAGKRQFAAKNQNAVKAGLNFTAIESLKLFVPPFSEQRKFVLFAEQVDKSKTNFNPFNFIAIIFLQ